MSTQTALNVAFKEEFKCCICLHLYTDPVTIPCAHNFCLDCIEGYWDSKGKSECPLCKQTFRKRPELRVNRGFTPIIDFMKRLGEDKEETEGEVEEDGDDLGEGVPCDVCAGDKSPAVNSCLVCQASFCEAHVLPHRREPALQRHRLTEPATFSGGHLCRNHNRPLTMFCKKEQIPVCERCTAGGHKHHPVVPMEKESRRVQSHLKATKSNIQKMIQTRQRKMEEINDSVDLSQKITEKEIQRSAQVCSMLTAAIQSHQAALVDELQAKQAESERRARQLLQELEREIGQLQARGGELQQLELSRSPLHLLQAFPPLSHAPPAKEWAHVAVHADHSMGTARRAVSKLVDVCQRVVDMLSEEEGSKRDQYAVDVTLDPDTASSWLILSPDLKKVSISSQKRPPLPNIPERFDTCVCVLGKQSFTCGRRYWEVEVGDKLEWDVGVARKSINRKGAVKVRPDNGFWAICRRKGGHLMACASPSSVTLGLQDTPQKVGVFLDYEEGAVSFYNADTKSHIYTYSGCDFHEPLHPYFNPCLHDNGRNAAPLVICPPARNDRARQEIVIESDV